MLSLYETTNVFIYAFLILQNSFTSVRTVLIDKNNVEIYTYGTLTDIQVSAMR